MNNDETIYLVKHRMHDYKYGGPPGPDVTYNYYMANNTKEVKELIKKFNLEDKPWVYIDNSFPEVTGRVNELVGNCQYLNRELNNTLRKELSAIYYKKKCTEGKRKWKRSDFETIGIVKLNNARICRSMMNGKLYAAGLQFGSVNYNVGGEVNSKLWKKIINVRIIEEVGEITTLNNSELTKAGLIPMSMN